MKISTKIKIILFIIFLFLLSCGQRADFGSVTYNVTFTQDPDTGSGLGKVHNEIKVNNSSAFSSFYGYIVFYVVCTDNSTVKWQENFDDIPRSKTITVKRDLDVNKKEAKYILITDALFIYQ